MKDFDKLHLLKNKVIKEVGYRWGSMLIIFKDGDEMLVCPETYSAVSFEIREKKKEKKGKKK